LPLMACPYAKPKLRITNVNTDSAHMGALNLRERFMQYLLT
jgi:hypothetical protein